MPLLVKSNYVPSTKDKRDSRMLIIMASDDFGYTLNVQGDDDIWRWKELSHGMCTSIHYNDNRRLKYVIYQQNGMMRIMDTIDNDCILLNDGAAIMDSVNATLSRMPRPPADVTPKAQPPPSPQPPPPSSKLPQLQPPTRGRDRLD